MESTWTVTLSLLFVALYAFYRYISNKQRYFESFNIPQLKPTFLLGNQGAILLRKRSVVEHVIWLYEQFPDAKYYGMYDFITPTILLKDLELIKDVAIKSFDHFTDKTPITLDEIDPLFSKNLLQLRGEKWRQYRSTLSPSFSGVKLKGVFHLINKCALDFNDFLKTHNASYGPVNTKDLFSRYTNDVIASAAFGLSVNSLHERDNEFFNFAAKASTFDHVKTMKLLMNKSFPRLARLFRTRLIDTETSDFFMKIIENNIKQRETEGIVRPDILQLLLQARKEAKGDVMKTTEDIAAQAFIFFTAGFETTATTMCWAAHLLAAHPQIEEKLARQVKERLASINDADNGYEALRDFHYLEAVVYETLRMYPPFAAMDRVCTERFELPPSRPGGEPMVIEPGMVLLYPIAGIHYDEQYYEEPREFRPERFLDSDGNLDKKAVDSTTLLPFGIGPRICIAKRFALLEVKLVLVHLLARCRLELSEKTPYPTKISKDGFQTKPENGFWLNLIPREDN